MRFLQPPNFHSASIPGTWVTGEHPFPAGARHAADKVGAKSFGLVRLPVYQRDCFGARWHTKLCEDRRNVVVDGFGGHKQALRNYRIAQAL